MLVYYRASDWDQCGHLCLPCVVPKRDFIRHSVWLSQLGWSFSHQFKWNRTCPLARKQVARMGNFSLLRTHMKTETLNEQPDFAELWRLVRISGNGYLKFPWFISHNLKWQVNSFENICWSDLYSLYDNWQISNNSKIMASWCRHSTRPVTWA